VHLSPLTVGAVQVVRKAEEKSPRRSGRRRNTGGRQAALSNDSSARLSSWVCQKPCPVGTRTRGYPWTLPVLGWLTLVDHYHWRPRQLPPAEPIQSSRHRQRKMHRLARVAETSARRGHQCARGSAASCRGGRLRRRPAAILDASPATPTRVVWTNPRLRRQRPREGPSTSPTPKALVRCPKA
jgi:hypothetical protein